MKKFMTIAFALCLVFAMVGEVMAISADFTGHLRVRGRIKDNPTLASSDADNASDARLDERFRLQGVFKANDNVSVTFRADMFEETLGANGNYDAVTNWNAVRAFITVKSDYGVSQFGRMAGGAWGATFGDYEGEFDRLRHTMKFGNLTTGFIFQKLQENDYGAAVDDQDLDVYYLFGVYGMENMKIALLYAYVDYNQVPGADGVKHAFLPWFKGTFGPIGVETEIIYETGTWEYDAPGVSDRDIDTLTYFIEVTWNSGPFGAELGWASQSGDDLSNNDIEAGNTGYGGIGEDWDKFVIFGDVDQLLNLSGTAPVTVYGVDMWYVGFSYQAMENLKLWFNVGGATMNEDNGAPDDDYGYEYDANLAWTIFPNLVYTVRAGYLSTGDAWKTINGLTEVDDTYTVYHKIQVNF